MIEANIKNKKRLCFLLKNGEANKIVIPVDYLQPVDFSRLKEMESKGGELMRTMRDTTLSNGVNALDQYKDIICVVPNEEPAKEETKEEASPAPKRRGRPKSTEK